MLVMITCVLVNIQDFVRPIGIFKTKEMSSRSDEGRHDNSERIDHDRNDHSQNDRHNRSLRVLGYIVVIYIVVLVITTLMFWRWCGIDRRVGALFGSTIALVVLLAMLPSVRGPTIRHEYPDVVLHQKSTFDGSESLIISGVVTVAWFIPLVLLGTLFLDRLSLPESRIGRMVTGLPEPCSTEETRTCAPGVQDPNQCRLAARTTVCGANRTTLVYSE
jgi:hypothetical protein